MSNERKQILEMLSQGKIGPEDAERLLDRLNTATGTGQSPGSPSDSPQSSPPQFMCIQVDSVEGDKVNVRLPIALVKSGIKLSAMMPKEAAATMTKNGVDFSQLSALTGDELATALRNMVIDVSSHGDQVKIFCE